MAGLGICVFTCLLVLAFAMPNPHAHDQRDQRADCSGDGCSTSVPALLQRDKLHKHLNNQPPMGTEEEDDADTTALRRQNERMWASMGSAESRARGDLFFDGAVGESIEALLEESASTYEKQRTMMVDKKTAQEKANMNKMQDFRKNAMAPEPRIGDYETHYMARVVDCGSCSGCLVPPDEGGCISDHTITMNMCVGNGGKWCKATPLQMESGAAAAPGGEAAFSLNPGAHCKKGYTPLTSSWQDCKAAAQAMGFSGDSIAHVDYNTDAKQVTVPQGCFQSSNTRFHFNPGAGGGSSGDKILCKLADNGGGGPSGCVDTPDWSNGHGFGCAGYETNWCANGAAKVGMEWTLGPSFKLPEENCCVCGKSGGGGPSPPPPTPGPTGCLDTPDWSNGHGFGCADYETTYNWCANGGANVGMEWTLGSSFKFPEENCCVCGKLGGDTPPQGGGDCNHVTSLTSGALVGRPGAPFSKVLAHQWWPWKGKEWEIERVRVKVTSATGHPASGCKVNFDTGFGASNGWIFPANPKTTGADGILEAIWVAGSAYQQKVTASLPSGSSAVIAGRAMGERGGNGGYINYHCGGQWSGVKISIEEKHKPDFTYFSTITTGPFYTGINTPHSIVFQSWWPKDPTIAGGFLQNKLLDPPNVWGHDAFKNKSMTCGAAVGPEGGTTGCSLHYDTTVGHKYSFTVTRENRPKYVSQKPWPAHNVRPDDDRPLGSTVLSAWFEDETLGFKHKLISVEAMFQMSDQGFTSFLERFGGEPSASCLELPTFEVIVRDVKCRTQGQTEYKGASKVNFVYPMAMANPIGSTGCSNIYGGFQQDGLHVALGGVMASVPAAMWNSDHLIGYGDGPGQFTFPSHNFETKTSTQPVTCDDGSKNGDEYGIDCGGACEKACAQGPGCSDGIQNNGEEYIDCGGSCQSCDDLYEVPNYFKVEGTRTWSESIDTCKSQGGRLATISNPWQHQRATKICFGACWIGLHRDQGCNDFTCWKWEDGQKYSDTMYNMFSCCTPPVWPYGATNVAVRLYHNGYKLSNWVASVPTEPSMTLCSKA